MYGNKGFYPWVVIFIALLLISIPASAEEITVCPVCGNDTIQAALANASNGDTIIVEEGTYNGSIVVDISNLIIRAEGTDSIVIIDAMGAYTAVSIFECENVTFEGFLITNVSTFGTGINAAVASDIRILNNTVDLDMSGVGIDVQNVTGAVVDGNKLDITNVFSAVGIKINETNNAHITNNDITINTGDIVPAFIYSKGIYARGYGIEIAENNITIDLELKLNLAETSLSEETGQEITQTLLESMNEFYSVIGPVAGDTNIAPLLFKDLGYIETFGIITYGPAVQIMGNEVNVSGKIDRKQSQIPVQIWADAIIVGIAAINGNPLEDNLAKVDNNTVIVNGEMQIQPITTVAIDATADRIYGNPATLNLGIFANGSMFEVTNNNISVSGTSITDKEGVPLFLGESYNLGIWTRTPEGNISENTINVDNLFEMNLSASHFAFGRSAAWSIGIVPQRSDYVEVSENNITVSANNNGTVIGTDEVLNADVSAGGIIYGIGIGIGTIWGSDHAQIDGNNINANGAVNLTVHANELHEIVGTVAIGAGAGAGIGAGIVVPYEEDNITQNNVAGTGSAKVEVISDTEESAFSSAFERGTGVLIIDRRPVQPNVLIEEPEQFNRVNFNNLVGSSDYGLYAFSRIEPELDVNATYNWWGTCDGPSDWGEGTGAAVNGTNDFTPWLKLPFEQHAFYGTVKDVNSINVPVDTVVIAFINDVERGRITVTEAGKYGSENTCGPWLIVNGDDAEEDSKILFEIKGVEADENASFMYGEVTQLNLTASASFPSETNVVHHHGDGKERIIYRAETNETPEPGGEGIVPTPTASNPEPTATVEEAPIKGKSKFPWLWWLLLLLLAIGVITYYQWNKAE